MAEVIDLTGGGPSRPAKDALPPWRKKRGMARVQLEYTALVESVNAGLAPFSHVALVGDNLMKWRLQISRFDDGLPGGRNINADLARLKRECGQDFILMEVELGHDYPDTPPFVRIVSPRIQQYSGHVTIGGSICIPLLSLTSQLQGWTSTMSVEGTLLVVIQNMVDAEIVQVRTPTGPGGMAGPLRIDFRGGYTMMPYSDSEARSAFSRVEAQHAGLW